MVETSSEDWWVYEAINLVTGQPGGRTNEVFGTSYLIVTDQGVYLNGRPRQTLGWMTPSDKLAEVLQ